MEYLTFLLFLCGTFKILELVVSAFKKKPKEKRMHLFIITEYYQKGHLATIDKDIHLILN